MKQPRKTQTTHATLMTATKQPAPNAGARRKTLDKRLAVVASVMTLGFVASEIAIQSINNPHGGVPGPDTSVQEAFAVGMLLTMQAVFVIVTASIMSVFLIRQLRETRERDRLKRAREGAGFDAADKPSQD